MLDNESVWCKGPELLYTPFAYWPISQRCEHELPDRRAVVLTSVAKEGLLSDINLGNFNNYQKLLKVTSRLLRCAKDRSFKGLFVEPSVEELKSAESLWIKAAQFRFRRVKSEIQNSGTYSFGWSNNGGPENS